MADPNTLDSLSLSDTDAENTETTEDLFASPKPQDSHTPDQHTLILNGDSTIKPSPAGIPDHSEDVEAAHEEALRKELSSLRAMNSVITGVSASLEKAKDNMDLVSTTVKNASTLLTTWTRILSQTEHNQRLILNTQWQGATQDIADTENEEILRQQEKERREAEEERRARQREAEREEEERRKTLEGSRGGRGRGRVSSRGSTSKTRGYVGVGGQGGGRGAPSSSTRGSSTAGRGSTVGRGVAGTRRARGS